MEEYNSKMPAVIKECKATCPHEAVIPSLTVETPINIKNLRNVFVHVTSNNTTYYIDDKGRSIITWCGPVYADNYDYVNNPLRLRSQTVYDFVNNIAIVYDRAGSYRTYRLDS